MVPDIPTSHLALACALTRPEGGRGARESARALIRDYQNAAPLPHQVARCLEDDVPGIVSALAGRGWRWVDALAPSFPARLAVVADPPIGLFVRGRLPAAPAVAIVGSRRASVYGREVAESFGRDVAAAGVWVVSGMARGLDAAAHRGALAAGGPTAAVWGCGPDRVYPPEHAELAEEIAGQGCLITEYPPGSKPLPHHFPERNRLIAGLVDVVLVVEADERSGALITARLALDEGREVMAVPGSVFSRLSVGPNGLLRSGAAPALSAADILEVLGVSVAADREVDSGPLEAFPRGEAVTVDHLCASMGKPITEVLEVLLRLELEGEVSREADGRYRRRSRL